MSRVEINAGSRHIVVDHDGELAHLAKTATELWDHTDGPEPGVGPATSVGFTAQRYSAPAPGSSMRHPVAPAQAETELS